VPIDGGVTANILSPTSAAYANAPQHAALSQQLAGNAFAQGNQQAAISQGGGPSGQGGAVTSTGGATPSTDASGAITTPADPTATGGSGLLPNLSSLLNINVKLDLGLDLAAPIDGAIAANANVAAPVDAAVGANVLSPNSTAVALAPQNDIIIQTLQGVANATVNQTSSINQAGMPTG
jgi:hypothetical protein